MNAALTGHLVLSTLHTNSAAGTIPRLMDMEVEPFLLSSTARVVIAQRLVRRIYGNKESYTLTKEEIEAMKDLIDVDKVLQALIEEGVVKKGTKLEELTLSRPVVSDEAPEGFRGRLVINEVLLVSPPIIELILSRASSDKIEEQARKEGMLTMAEDGFFKAVQGLTTLEEVFRVISE